MQVVGPYRLVGELGSGEVGTVWAAVDPAGVEVTLAVLDPAAASDQGWRDAFSSAANELARGGMPALHADFTAAAPWVAVAAGPGPGAEQIFTALGQEYRSQSPPHSEGDEAAVQPAPVALDPPAPPIAESPGQVSPGLISPSPVSGDGSWAGEPSTRASTAGRRPGRAGAWIGAAALVALLPGLGGAVIATTIRPPDDQVGARPSPSVASPGGATRAPGRPGIEPPVAKPWPDDWPKFAAVDRTTVQSLGDLGFSFRVPEGWVCARVPREGGGAARYRCGVPSEGRLRIGGDLLSRTCRAPCDEIQRAEMRKDQDAFGLQWIRSGRFTHWAAGSVDVDGGQTRALTAIFFWDSPPQDRLDRQIVFRMTAPESDVDELHKVLNDIRDALVDE